jgi:hypothetical protein
LLMTHSPVSSKYPVLHERQSVVPGPLQVRQDEWQSKVSRMKSRTPHDLPVRSVPSSLYIFTAIVELVWLA